MILPYAPPPASVRTPPPIVRRAAGELADDGACVRLAGETAGDGAPLRRRFFTVDDTGRPAVRGLPKWDAAARRRFAALAAKYAAGTLDEAEREELSLLRAARSAETPAMTYEELVRRAAVERARELVIAAREEYARAKAAEAQG